MYKLKKYSISDQINHVENLDNGSIIPFDPANVDYQAFKAQINNESAQLETADGVLMTPEEAKAYVATLP
jgi:hypothetical protein